MWSGGIGWDGGGVAWFSAGQGRLARGYRLSCMGWVRLWQAWIGSVRLRVGFWVWVWNSRVG